jgi:hypothetical protein
MRRSTGRSDRRGRRLPDDANPNVDREYHILAAAVADQPNVLKNDGAFLVADRRGDMPPVPEGFKPMKMEGCGIGLLRRSASVASAPAAFRVRVWAVMSRGRRPRGGCPPPEGVDVAYPQVLARQQATLSGLRDDLLQEGGGYLAVEQTLAILGEDRGIPHRVIHVQADEPAEEQVVVQLPSIGARSGPYRGPPAIGRGAASRAGSTAGPPARTGFRTAATAPPAPHPPGSASPGVDGPAALGLRASADPT